MVNVGLIGDGKAAQSAGDPYRALAGASLDRGAYGCYMYQRIKRGLYAPPTSLTGNGGE